MNDLKGIIEDCNKSDLVSDKIIKKIIEIIGQEEWQDLHDENNDICTTMGELIITLKGIADLEKENAELKHTIAELRRDKDNLNTHTKAQEKLSEYRSNQLTKAKEVINDLVHLGEFNEHTDEEYFNYQVHEVLKNAEQFLKE